jgi:ElaB/YqjD/DUF883 family membrane-anchored ribosome-binding protein
VQVHAAFSRGGIVPARVAVLRGAKPLADSAPAAPWVRCWKLKEHTMALDHETLDETGATDDAVTTMPDTSLDPLGAFAVDLPPQVRDFITDRPVAATLASAAVGAGLVALLLFATRDNSGLKSAVSSKVDAAHDSFANLRAQVTDLASKVAATLPSREDASAAVESSKGKAQDLMDRLRPYVGATSDLARAYPVWTSVAVGALGALLGSQMRVEDPTEKARAEAG